MYSLSSSRARSCYLIAATICVLLIAAALYFQYVVGLDPCPLCIFQRIAVMMLGVWFLVMAVIHPGGWGRRFMGLIAVLVASAGGAVAARQVWLQHLPEAQVPACGPGLDYMLDMLPLRKVMDLVFRGSGECAEVHWTFLSLSIAGWMLVIFTGFVLFALFLVFVNDRDTRRRAQDLL